MGVAQALLLFMLPNSSLDANFQKFEWAQTGSNRRPTD